MQPSLLSYPCDICKSGVVLSPPARSCVQCMSLDQKRGEGGAEELQRGLVPSGMVTVTCCCQLLRQGRR